MDASVRVRTRRRRSACEGRRPGCRPTPVGAAEVASGTKYSESLVTGCRPPHIRAMSEEQAAVLRKSGTSSRRCALFFLSSFFLSSFFLSSFFLLSFFFFLCCLTWPFAGIVDRENVFQRHQVLQGHAIPAIVNALTANASSADTHSG